LPTQAHRLSAVLKKRSLDLVGAFVPVAFADKTQHKNGIETALKTAKLMYDAGFPEAFIVLSDNNGTLPERTQYAGRISPKMGLSEHQWENFAAGIEKIAQTVKNNYGMRTVFHHHCGGYIETPEEVNALLAITPPELVGLCLDTGHYAFGGGNPLEALQQYKERIWHIHFKDYAPTIAQKVFTANGDYFEAVKKGVFCALGKGNVDFKKFAETLKTMQYEGWVVVEQDVLPGMGSPKKCAQSNRNYINTLEL